MRRIVLGEDQRVAAWVSAHIPGADDFGPDAVAIGMEEDGALIGGVVYNNYTGSGISMHCAGTNKHWVSKELLRLAFAYPFKVLKVNRVTGLVRVDNEAAQKFDERLGFQREGVLRRGDDDGCDLIVYGMLEEECRWLTS